MIGSDNSILVPLIGIGELRLAPERRGEPITIGVPLPRGVVRSATALTIARADGELLPVQARCLDTWPDGSVRWVLLDFRADAEGGRATPLLLKRLDDPARPQQAEAATALRVEEIAGGVVVETGRLRLSLVKGAAFPFSAAAVGGMDVLDEPASGLRLAVGERTIRPAIADVAVASRGPLRAEIDVTAGPGEGSWPRGLVVTARLELFAQSGVVWIDVTLRNNRRARHAGGQWVLGDPGSIRFTAAELVVAATRALENVRASVEPGSPLTPRSRPFELHQESSGGRHWNGPVHRNRRGIVPLRYRGYRVREGGSESSGERAEPIISADCAGRRLAVAVPRFWENFPQSLRIVDRAVEVGIFARSADVHELQGGEQKTHRIALSFGDDAVAGLPLAWCCDPLPIYVPADWCCRSEAVPYLVAAAGDEEAGYLELVNLAHDPVRGFDAKRERFDEYGWRNFGDLPADHESAFQPDDQPFVSHYNNQYDAIAAFGVFFLRTGDRRWLRLMDDLAGHVRDIDIYHTIEDKAAYNGGLFWHTYHYVDAGTSTHRTYPRGIRAGGGPSAEHNYPAGLMLHYFLTGDRASRDAAIGLAEWVLTMEDGRLTPFRWLASGPTGLASATGSADYHGPGRAAANSIVACLVGLRLTGRTEFARKTNELIRRCIHPHDDLQARRLLDTERRWYYTVFLQALGVYLHDKRERGELDAMFAYAQHSLLHYARWMAAHERPYLDRPDVLEFPTETWAAQDLRKAEVFWWAAMHAPDPERAAFHARAAFFRSYAIEALAAFPTRHFTRPLVLLLRHPRGPRTVPALQLQPLPACEPPVPFVAQKTRALARLRLAAALAAAGLTLLAAALYRAIDAATAELSR